MKPWIKKTVATLFGASLLVGGLSGCARHHHDASWSDDRVTEVRVSKRLKDSPVVALQADTFASPGLRRLMRELQRRSPDAAPAACQPCCSNRTRHSTPSDRLTASS